MSVKGLQAWLLKLSKQSMPVAGHVIAELNALTGSDETTLAQLGEVILRDPNLTSHVLRISNSVYYNQTGTPVNTVSRAIALIGLKGMRAISISVLLIDALLAKGPKERLLMLMAQGFHAATQARNIMRRLDDTQAEEVFVAALLYNLGEMAFWSSEKLTLEKAKLFDLDTQVRNQAMTAILGTSFKAITCGLAKQWHLGATLEQALYPSDAPSLKVQTVILGERLSHAALFGWDSAEVNSVIVDIAALVGVDTNTCTQWVKDSAEQALDVATGYGAASVCALIPSPSQQLATQEKRKANIGRVLHADAQLQLSILRELTTATNDRTDVNTIFQMVIEGIHRGIGMERVVIAFIQHHRVKAKYALGQGTERWREVFDFDVSPFCDTIFTHAIKAGGCTWVTPELLSRYNYDMNSEIGKCLGEVEGLIFVLEVNGRKPALFYADRADFGGKITQDHVDSFQHFAAQAQFNLSLVSHAKR